MKKVLVVDDESDICYLLTQILKTQNVETHTVSNLHDAMDLVKSGNYDGVFLDNHLPDGYGVEFIAEIKGKQPRAKIILISAFNNDETKAKAMKNGADDVIWKPFGKDNILSKVANF